MFIHGQRKLSASHYDRYAWQTWFYKRLRVLSDSYFVDAQISLLYFLKSHWHQRDKNPKDREGRVFRKCLHLPHCPHTFSKRRDFRRSGNDGEGVARVCGSFSFLTLLKVYQATFTLAWPILATGWLLESEKAFHRYGFRGKQRKVACDSPKGRTFRRN